MEQESQELARRTERNDGDLRTKRRQHSGTYQILRCAGNLAIHSRSATGRVLATGTWSTATAATAMCSIMIECAH